MAARLILSLNGMVLKEYPVDKERMTIGRKSFNDIAIDNLAISGEHAAIVTLSDDSFLEDLDSTNGVIVNGAEIQKHFLRHNDVIEIGRHKLVYLNEQQSPLADPEKTAVIRSAASRAAALEADRATFQKRKNSTISNSSSLETMTVQSVQPTAMIQILTGPNASKELALVKSLTTLGKPGVQVAVITRRPNGFFITHVEGSKFPLLNGQAINDQSHLLQDHDVIELAGIKMEFYLK